VAIQVVGASHTNVACAKWSTNEKQRRGYRVATAPDGIDGLNLLRTTDSICFVLVDLFMPRLDGFGMLRAMVNEPKLATLPRLPLDFRARSGAARCGVFAQTDRFASSLCRDRPALPDKPRSFANLSS
jgi:hypothetical protein